MKISGFTFVKNAVKFDYPIVESIKSILPIVDEYIVLCGDSEDSTEALIRSIGSPKIKVHHSTWDPQLKEGGHVLATETNKAFDLISPDADWAFYLQADEVIHEKDLPPIQAAAQQYLDNKEVEGLLFSYIHFLGTYDYVGDSRRWYNNEIRLIRNDKGIRSYRDAQGFRKSGRKMKVKVVDSRVYHYGWVRHPEMQQRKLNTFYSFWAGSNYNSEINNNDLAFDFINEIDSVQKFRGSHPAVMKERIHNKNWNLQLDTSKKRFSFKDTLLYRFEKLTGKRLFAYRNYKII